MRKFGSWEIVRKTLPAGREALCAGSPACFQSLWAAAQEREGSLSGPNTVSLIGNNSIWNDFLLCTSRSFPEILDVNFLASPAPVLSHCSAPVHPWTHFGFYLPVWNHWLFQIKALHYPADPRNLHFCRSWKAELLSDLRGRTHHTGEREDMQPS